MVGWVDVARARFNGVEARQRRLLFCGWQKRDAEESSVGMDWENEWQLGSPSGKKRRKNIVDS